MSGDMFVEDNSEEDEEGFNLDADAQNSTARLATLFSQDSKMRGNETLTYTAPKQPSARGSVEPSKSTSSSAVLNATVVYAFMLKDGKFQPLGKLGLAIVYNKDKKEGKMLLYHANRKPVTQAVIGQSSALSVQTDTYISVVDTSGRHWSLAFDNHDNLVKFCQWYMACQGCSLDDHDSQLHCIDLKVGEGNRVGSGDLVEIEYLEYVIESGPSFTEFNGNFNSDQTLRLKIGKKKMPKGWEDGIIGMRKLGKRLFLIPPDIGYSGHAASATFPTNTPIMVLVNVKRVKFGAAAGHKSHSEKIEAANTAETIPHDEEVISESMSLSENMENDDSAETISSFIEKSIPMLSDGLDAEQSKTTPEPQKEKAEASASSPSGEDQKASLVNRMARIGQPLLPGMSTAVPASQAPSNVHSSALPDLVSNEPSKETSDSGSNRDTEQPSSPTKLNPVPKPNPIAIVCAELPTKSRSSSITTASSMDTSSHGVPSSHFQPGNPQYPMPYMFPYPHGMPSAFYPFGTPVTTNDGASSANPNQIHQGFPAGGFYPFPNPYSHMTTDGNMKQLLEEMRESQKVLQSEIRVMIQESLSSVSEKVTDLNGNIEKSLKNIRDSDATSNLDSGRAQEARDQLLAKLDAIEKKLSDPLSTSVEHPEFSSSGRLLDIPAKLDVLSAKIVEEHNWREKYETLATQAFKIKAQYEEEIAHLKEELSQAKRQGEYRLKEQEKIKTIMSNFYKSVTREFDPEEVYHADLIKKMVLKLVKECTLRVLESPEKTEQLEAITAEAESTPADCERKSDVHESSENAESKQIETPNLPENNRGEADSDERVYFENHEADMSSINQEQNLSQQDEPEGEQSASTSVSDFQDSTQDPIDTAATATNESKLIKREDIDEEHEVNHTKRASTDEMEESFHSTHDSSPYSSN